MMLQEMESIDEVAGQSNPGTGTHMAYLAWIYWTVNGVPLWYDLFVFLFEAWLVLSSDIIIHSLLMYVVTSEIIVFKKKKLPKKLKSEMALSKWTVTISLVRIIV